MNKRTIKVDVDFSDDDSVTRILLFGTKAALRDLAAARRAFRRYPVEALMQLSEDEDDVVKWAAVATLLTNAEWLAQAVALVDP